MGEAADKRKPRGLRAARGFGRVDAVKRQRSPFVGGKRKIRFRPVPPKGFAVG